MIQSYWLGGWKIRGTDGCGQMQLVLQVRAAGAEPVATSGSWPSVS